MPINAPGSTSNQRDSNSFCLMVHVAKTIYLLFRANEFHVDSMLTDEVSCK